MQLNLSFNLSKKLLAAVFMALIAGLIIIFFFSKSAGGDPIPPAIKSQLSYRAIYPNGYGQIQSNSYKYQPSNKTLSYKLHVYDSGIVFTEQPAPESLGKNGQPYYPAIGLHPYAQFQTELGPVALTKFYQSGSLQPVGQSAVLASGGTLLIANSQKSLTNQQWKNLFNSLKIAR
jgi:hypothetical protein